MEWQGAPSTVTQGQRVEYRVFARGAPDGWKIHFRWNNKNNDYPRLGYFDIPTTYPYWEGEGCPNGATCTMGMTATTPGVANVYAWVEDGDWRTDDVQCQISRPVTVVACTPNCPVNCGQANGCGGTCPTTNMGAPPAAPTPVYPAANSNVYPTGTTVTLTWNSPGGTTDLYEVQVGNANNVNSMCGTPGSDCPTVSGTSVGFTITNGVYIYAYRVRAVNTSCGQEPSAWSSWTYFGILGQMNGSFQTDPNQTARLSGGVCTGGSGSVVSPGSGAGISSIGIDGATRNASITGSTWSLVPYYWNPGNNTLTLTPGLAPNGAPYECTCPAGCRYSGISSPQANVNFFLKQNDLINGGWWQVLGGNVYAGQASGIALRSYVPIYYCTLPMCIPYILGRDRADKPDSAGAVVSGGGIVDSSKDPGNQTLNVTQRTSQTIALGSASTRIKENFDYFWREFSLGLSPTDDFATTAGDARKPTSVPGGGKAAYYHNGNLTIQNQWIVNTNEKIVVFVNGNLTLSDPSSVAQLIRVEEGGFLAFIVRGNITIEPSVGNNDNLTSLTPNVEGVYIADGTLGLPSKGIAAGGDERFIGAGTFVGWTNVDIQRDFDNGGQRKAENNTKPAAVFIYRPDFIVNLPEIMLRSSYIWQETN